MHLRSHRLRLRMLWRRMRRPRSLFHHSMLRLAYARRRARVGALPVAIDVEPINVCNFRCAHCQVTHWKKPRTEMGLEAFERVLAQIPTLWRVKLQGMGEPFLSKQLLPMLDAADARGLEMVVITNGSALTQANGLRLASLRNTHVVVSMDGATATVFEQARAGGRFHDVVANTRRLVGLRNGSRSPVVELRSVITKRNVHELSDIVRLCGDIGADRVTLQLMLTDWGKAGMRRHTVAVAVNRRSPELTSLLDEAAALASDMGVGLEVQGMDRCSRARPCAVPWTTAFIAANGDVVPCCIVADADVACMGNVFERPFVEIWNGAAYRDLRERLTRHDLPAYCVGCYEDPPRS